MEFLPPDVAPLHDPALSECVPRICLDPRRAAEEACTASLATFDGSSPVGRLSMDIERALNDPEVYQLPRIVARAAKARDLSSNFMEQVYADTLAATTPLFKLRYHHETSDAKMHEVYIALAGLAHRTSFKGVHVPLRRGIGAEIAMHAVLLRGGRNVPYLSSPREESSQQPMLNNDLGLYCADTGRTEKVPVQIKRANGVRQKYIDNRVLPIIAEKVCSRVITPILDISQTGHQDYVDLVYSLVAQEASEGLFDSTSPQGKALDSLGNALNDEIDEHRKLFKEAAKEAHFGHALQGLIDGAFGNRPGIMVKAEFYESRYTQLTSGAYIFFNRLTAVRREHESDPGKNKYRLTFSLNDLPLETIEYSGETQALSFTGNPKYPEKIAIQLLSSLLEGPDIIWNQC